MAPGPAASSCSELDPETGLVIHPQADEENQVDPYFGKRLIGGGHNSIEGPYIQYDETSGYYYLLCLLRRPGAHRRLSDPCVPQRKRRTRVCGYERGKPRMGYAHVKLRIKAFPAITICQAAAMPTWPPADSPPFGMRTEKQYLCYHFPV